MSELPLRDDLRGMEPYGAPVSASAVPLNVNENPYAPPAAIVEEMGRAVASALVDANRYPDREATQLRAALAEYVGGVSAANIWAANGSNEVMQHLFGAFGGPGRVALSFSPTYSMYPQYARETFTRFVTVPRRADHSLDRGVVEQALFGERPSIVVVASPNNPTGTLLGSDELSWLVSDCAGVGAILVVDEAYGEFVSPTRHSATQSVLQYGNLVVTRTLSKAFGLAALRLGYAVAPAGIVDALRLVRLPYHLSAATQAAALVALQHADTMLGPIPTIRAEREQLAVALESLGLNVAASEANFVYVSGFADSHRVFSELLDRGYLVRESGPPGNLRISVGTPQQNRDLIQQLSEVLEP